MYRRHNCPWRTAQSRLLLDSYGLFGERDFYRAWSDVTYDLGFCRWDKMQPYKFYVKLSILHGYKINTLHVLSINMPPYTSVWKGEIQTNMELNDKQE